MEFRTNRRRFLATMSAIIPAALASNAFAQKSSDDKTTSAASSAGDSSGPFSLPKLPYAHDALEPHIDSKTMEIHHGKHHAAYVQKLNAAVGKDAKLTGETLPDQLMALYQGASSESVKNDIRNQGGGHLNHTLFWHIMTPGGAKKPSGELADAINSAFGSFEDFQKKFQEAGEKRFGSGWAWLVKTKDGKLEVRSTANQDTPIMEGLYPVIGNDVWEHAYYLKYQNKRADYLKAWWNVVNWDKAAEGFAKGHSVFNV